MKAIAELVMMISEVLRMLAELLLKYAGGEVTEKDLQHQATLLNQNFKPQPADTGKPSITFEAGKGMINKVAMNVRLMIDMGWIIAKDENGQIIKDFNKMKAANWMGLQLFGKPFKKWDQLMQYIFRERTEKERDEFLKIFDKMKELAKRRIKTY